MPSNVSPLAPDRPTGANTPAAPAGDDKSAPTVTCDQGESQQGYDLVFDTSADGHSLKCLTIVDEFTRECLAIDVAGIIRSGRVIEVLAQLVSVHEAPRYLRSDNGPEFVATAISRWLQNGEIETAFASRSNGIGIAAKPGVGHRAMAAALQ